MLDGQKKLYKNDGIARPGTRQPRKTRKSVTHGNRKNRHGDGKTKTAMRFYPDMESPPMGDMNDVKLAVVDFGDADGEPLWPHRHHQRCHTYYLYMSSGMPAMWDNAPAPRAQTHSAAAGSRNWTFLRRQSTAAPHTRGWRGVYMRAGPIMGIMRMAGARPGPGRRPSRSCRSPPLTPLNMFRR